MKDLTIIIPIFNGDKYIDRVLSSLLPLAKELNIEIIIIDDHSTDNTMNLCLNYESRYEFVKVITNPINKGVSFCRNKGIKESQGKYLFFLDVDDYIVNPSFNKLFTATNAGYDIICFSVISLKGPQQIYNHFVCANEMALTKNKLLHNTKILIDVNTITWIKNKLYKSSIIKENNVFFDEKISFSEDLLFNIRLFPYISNIFFIHEYLIYYDRNIPNSLSKLQEKNYISEFINSTYYLNKFFNKNNICCDSAYYKDRKDLLLYSIDKVVHSNSEKSHKLKQLKLLYSKQVKSIIKYLNIANKTEWFIWNCIKRKNLNLLLEELSK